MSDRGSLRVALRVRDRGLAAEVGSRLCPSPVVVGEPADVVVSDRALREPRRRLLAVLGPHHVLAAYAQHVDSVLLRDDLDELPEALDLMSHGYRLSPVLAPDSAGMPPDDAALLALLAAELPDHDIAETLFCSRSQLHRRLRALYRRIGASTRSDAAAAGRRAGFAASSSPSPLSRDELS